MGWAWLALGLTATLTSALGNATVGGPRRLASWSTAHGTGYFIATRTGGLELARQATGAQRIGNVQVDVTELGTIYVIDSGFLVGCTPGWSANRWRPDARWDDWGVTAGNRSKGVGPTVGPYRPGSPIRVTLQHLWLPTPFLAGLTALSVLPIAVPVLKRRRVRPRGFPLGPVLP